VKIPGVVFESLPRGEYYLFPSLPPRKMSSLSQGDFLYTSLKRILSSPRRVFLLLGETLLNPLRRIFSLPQGECDHFPGRLFNLSLERQYSL